MTIKVGDRIPSVSLKHMDEGGIQTVTTDDLFKGKKVVLGLVSSKTGSLETADELKRRIDEAAKYVPLESLCLSPQCGFSSTEEGNDITHDEQRRKLELIVETAEKVWG